MPDRLGMLLRVPPNAPAEAMPVALPEAMPAAAPGPPPDSSDASIYGRSESMPPAMRKGASAITIRFRKTLYSGNV